MPKQPSKKRPPVAKKISSTVRGDVSGALYVAETINISQPLPVSVVDDLLARVARLEGQARESDMEQQLEATRAEIALLKSEAIQSQSRLVDELFRQQLWRDALEPITSLLRHLPDNASLFKIRGIARLNFGDYVAAIKDFDESIKLDPKNAQAYRGRGAAHGALGDYAAVIKDFGEAIELDPRDAQAHRNRGAARANLGDHAGAIKDFDEAIRFNPADAQAHRYRGIARRRLGQYQEAIVDFERAVALDPANAGACHFDLMLAARFGELYDKALTSLHYLLGVNPDSFDMHLGLASVYDHLGQRDKFLHHLAEARKLLPGQPPYTIACLESVEGNRGAALAALKQAAAAPDFDHAWAAQDPDLANIRKDNRFWKIVKRPPPKS